MKTSLPELSEESPKIWVVAACFNEEEVITHFIQRILSILGVGRLILVDDGSKDNTVLKIKDYQENLCREESLLNITLIELTRNFGKESAMLAGLDYVKGKCDAVVLIDSDLQHPPELIVDMIKAWLAGAEIVTAVRNDRDEESRLKVTTASWFYKIFNRIVDSIQIREGAGDYRLLSAPVISALTEMREFSRFSKGLIPWTGYSSYELSYQRIARAGGRTSWSPLKLLKYALDGIFSFSVLPLRIWGVLGLSVSILSLIYSLIIIFRTFLYGIDVPGYASLIVAILFLGGIQLIGIGVLGDYLGRIYVDTKSRPHYFIRGIYDSN